MISEQLTYAVELSCDTVRQTIKQPLIRFDEKAHTLVCVVNQNGAGADLTNCTATLNAVRADGATATVSATISGSIISADLPPAVYNVAGVLNVYLRLVNGTYKRTILWLSGTVVAGDTLTYVDSTTTLPSIEQFNTLKQQCETAAASANSALAVINAFPAQTVHNDAVAAANSAQSAAESAAAASAASGLPTGGQVGNLLVKTATGASWSNALAPVWQAIGSAGHEISAGSAVYNDDVSVARYATSEERTFTFELSNEPDAVIITGISPSGVNGISVHSQYATISGSTVTVHYKATNSYSASTKPNTLTAYYVAFY